MNAAFAAVLAAPALAIGSFLNVVATRMPLRRSIGTAAPACMSCDHELALTTTSRSSPTCSSGAAAATCQAAIPLRYPAVEALTALLVVGCFLRFGPTAEALVAAFFCIVLVAISAIDIEHRIVPNRIVLPAAAIVLVRQTLLHPSPEWAIAAVGAAGFLFVAALAYPKGMGMGDVKLALLLGAMLGRNVTVALMVGCWRRSFLQRCSRSAMEPAPARSRSRSRRFWRSGPMVALFYGNAILDRYLATF